PHPLTRTGVVMGTPMYMAPERGRGAKRATPASDMFSLGLIGYEVLSGEYPEFGPGRAGPLARVVPLAAACPAVPSFLTALLDRCLREEPTERPGAGELAAALAAALAASPHENGGRGTAA